MRINPLYLTDAYKHSHRPQYPDHTQFVYSNTTARKSRMEGVDHVVVFGTRYLVTEYLIDTWNECFFGVRKSVAVEEFKLLADAYLGPGAVDVSCFEVLYDLGYLPIEVKALKEGTLCPIGVPFMTIVNTHPDFFWLTNFIETLTQTVLWQPITSATIAHEYRKVLDSYAAETSDIPGFVDWQGHDFSMRGMSSPESGMTSGMGHLLSFTGTDTISAIVGAMKYYDANLKKEIVGGSVPATEHSVSCAHGRLNDPKEVVEVYNEETGEWEFSRFVF